MERRLVERAQDGDQAAFAEIAFAINARLFAIAHRILRDFHLAEDATQQALVLIWRDLPKLGDPARFDAWSYRVLVNACYAQARHGRRADEGVHLLGSEASLEDPEARIAEQDLVARAFLRLTPEQRAVLVLQYYLDLPSAEIAETLGIPLGTVKSRASNAKSALRAALEADARAGMARWTA